MWHNLKLEAPVLKLFQLFSVPFIFIISSVQCAVWSVQCVVWSVQRVVCSVQCDLYKAKCSSQNKCFPLAEQVQLDIFGFNFS